MFTLIEAQSCAGAFYVWRGLCVIQRRVVVALRKHASLQYLTEHVVPEEVELQRMRRRLIMAKAKLVGMADAHTLLKSRRVRVAVLERKAYAEALQRCYESLRMTVMWYAVQSVVVMVSDASRERATDAITNHDNNYRSEFVFGVGTPMWFPKNSHVHFNFDVHLSVQELSENMKALAYHVQQAMASLQEVMHSSGLELRDYEIRQSTSDKPGSGKVWISKRLVTSTGGAMYSHRHILEENTFFHGTLQWQCVAGNTPDVNGINDATTSGVATDIARSSWFRALTTRLCSRNTRATRQPTQLESDEWDVVNV